MYYSAINKCFIVILLSATATVAAATVNNNSTTTPSLPTIIEESYQHKMSLNGVQDLEQKLFKQLFNAFNADDVDEEAFAALEARYIEANELLVQATADA